DVGWWGILNRLPQGAQCLPGGYVPDAGDSNIGERQKQADSHEGENDEHLKCDRAALVHDERFFMAHARASTHAYRFRSPILSNGNLKHVHNNSLMHGRSPKIRD